MLTKYGFSLTHLFLSYQTLKNMKNYLYTKFSIFHRNKRNNSKHIYIYIYTHIYYTSQSFPFFFLFYQCDCYLFQQYYKHEFYKKVYNTICQLFEIQTLLVFDLHFATYFYHKSNINFLNTLFVLCFPINCFQIYDMVV